LLHVLELVGRDDLVLSEDAGLVPAVRGLDDRHHHLAGDVAAHDERVGLVELGGVQELAPALLGAVHVAGVVELHDPPSRARASAWSEMISQAMLAARSAVGWPGESYDGETSTTSPPTRLIPVSARTNACACPDVGPPTSGVPVPGV